MLGDAASPSYPLMSCRIFLSHPRPLDASYEAVALRMGVSGAVQDDLSSELGLDQYAQPPAASGSPAKQASHEVRNASAGFGRRRISHGTGTVCRIDSGERRQAGVRPVRLMYVGLFLDDPCIPRPTMCAFCSGMPGFSYRPGFIVERVLRDAGYMAVQGDDGNGKQTWRAHRVLLAAGTIASTRFALMAMDKPLTVGMQSCPTAAFIVWVPRVWGRSRSAAFGLGQLAYTLDLSAGQCKAYGGLFDTTGIPMAEFSKFMPLGKRFGVDLLSSLLSSCAVGNLFLPGRHTNAALSLRQHDVLHVSGQYDDEVPSLMAQAAKHLRTAFRQIGAWVLPRSFTVGHPGSDIHYAASFPMRHRPNPGQTDPWGEVCGVQGLHIG